MKTASSDFFYIAIIPGLGNAHPAVGFLGDQDKDQRVRNTFTKFIQLWPTCKTSKNIPDIWNLFYTHANIEASKFYTHKCTKFTPKLPKVVFFPSIWFFLHSVEKFSTPGVSDKYMHESKGGSSVEIIFPSTWTPIVPGGSHSSPYCQALTVVRTLVNRHWLLIVAPLVNRRWHPTES